MQSFPLFDHPEKQITFDVQFITQVNSQLENKNIVKHLTVANVEWKSRFSRRFPSDKDNSNAVETGTNKSSIVVRQY